MQKTYRGGNDVFEIEIVCGLSKVEYLKTIYQLDKIRNRKLEAGFKTLVGSVLTKISVLSGIKTEIDAFTKQDIIKMMTTTYSELSIEEVYKAFELERYGVYETRTEHFQLFDTAFISEVLKKYKNWKVKEKQILNINTPKIEKEVTEEEKKQIRDRFLVTVFEAIRDEKFYSSAWLLFEDVESKLSITNAVKKRLYRIQDKRNLLALALDVKANGKRPHHVELLETAQKNSRDGKLNVIVQNRCKAIVVCNFLKRFKDFNEFKKQIEDGME